MKPWVNGLLGVALVALIVTPAMVRYRNLYGHHKRLREVTAGKFYRAGQLTGDGMTDAIERLGIRTIINVQEDVPAPIVDQSFWNHTRVPEIDLCKRLGVRYELITIDPSTSKTDIAKYLALLDDPKIYPVLLHCRAGLHRTGVLTAVYRMEYEGWSHAAAAGELKGHGFGDAACTAANTYVQKFVLEYLPRSTVDRAATGK